MASCDPQLIDLTMKASFRRVEKAVRYRRWVLDQASPHLGKRILEVGAGVGNITADLLVSSDRVVALDVSEVYLRELQRRLGPTSDALRTLVLSLDDGGLSQALAEEKLESALLLNVLEHIEDEQRALRNLSRALVSGASVVIQVPAHGWLYGEADRALGHVRRYSPASLEDALYRSGLTLERIWQFNTLGVAGWFVSGRLRRETMFSELQLLVYEALVPLQRLVEPIRGVPLGLSLTAVARTS